MTRWPLAFAAIALALLHGASYWSAGPIDDDFICHVFGRSLLEGRGFAWWGSAQVEGFTVPLWVVLHGIGQGLGILSVDLSRVVGIVSAGIAAWALGSAWRMRTGATHGGPAWVLAAAPAFAFHACAGLGTTLLAALIALWLRALVEEEAGDEAERNTTTPPRRLAGIWLGLACLLRQECVLLWLIWVVLGTKKSSNAKGFGRWLPPSSAWTLVALAGWSLVRWFWFGRLVPISFSVKGLPLGVDLAYGWRYLIGDLPLLGTVLLAPAAIVLLVGKARRSVDRVIAAGFLVYALFIIGVGGDFVAWSRFFVPAFPLGLWSLAVICSRWPWAMWSTIAACLLLQWPAFLEDENVRGRGARFLDHQVFEQRWSAIGRWMGDNAPTGTRVGTSPIGAMAWHSGVEVLDLLGLVHPHAEGLDPNLDIQVKGHHRSATDWMIEQAPEWIVLGNGTRIGGRLEINPWEAALFQSKEFQGAYSRVEVDLGEGPPLDLFVRHGWPLPEGVR